MVLLLFECIHIWIHYIRSYSERCMTRLLLQVTIKHFFKIHFRITRKSSRYYMHSDMLIMFIPPSTYCRVTRRDKVHYIWNQSCVRPPYIPSPITLVCYSQRLTLFYRCLATTRRTNLFYRLCCENWMFSYSGII